LRRACVALSLHRCCAKKCHSCPGTATTSCSRRWARTSTASGGRSPANSRAGSKPAYKCGEFFSLFHRADCPMFAAPGVCRQRPALCPVVAPGPRSALRPAHHSHRYGAAGLHALHRHASSTRLPSFCPKAMVFSVYSRSCASALAAAAAFAHTLLENCVLVRASGKQERETSHYSDLVSQAEIQLRRQALFAGMRPPTVQSFVSVMFWFVQALARLSASLSSECHACCCCCMLPLKLRHCVPLCTCNIIAQLRR
jgi:hypothetical protein